MRLKARSLKQSTVTVGFLLAAFSFSVPSYGANGPATRTQNAAQCFSDYVGRLFGREKRKLAESALPQSDDLSGSGWLVTESRTPERVIFNLEKAPEFVAGKAYDAKTLEERLFAVHATEFFPENGVIQAGASDISGAQASVAFEPPSFRPTTHWSLGELVQPHSRASWDSKPYAVILPMKALKKQLVNLNTYDTFTLGSVTLPEGTIIVAPKGLTKQLPVGAKIEFYDPGVTLRSAVDQTIEKYGGWHVRMDSGVSPSADVLGRINGHNVNTPGFFRSILRENPTISFGSHIASLEGTAYRMGNIEQAVNILMKPYRGSSAFPSRRRTVFLRKFIDHHLTKFDQEMRSVGLPKAAVASYAEKVKKLKGWLNLVDVDLELGRLHGRSFVAAPKKIAQKIESLRADPVALRKYVFSGWRRWRMSRVGQQDHSIWPSEMAEYLAAAPKQEAEELLSFAAKQGLMTASEIGASRALYSVKRALMMDLPHAKKEGLFELIESSFREIGSDSKTVDDVMSTIGGYLDPASNRMSSALRLLESSGVKPILERRYGIQIPDSGLTLDGWLRLYPETRRIYEPIRQPGSSTADAILEGLGVYGSVKSLQKKASYRADSFLRARSQAYSLEHAEKTYATDLAQIQLPMSTIRDLDDLVLGTRITIYEQMKRGDMGAAEEIWGKLGLKTQYREMFPNDQDFWTSPLSFEEIYLKLSGKS